MRDNYAAMGGREVIAGQNVRCDYPPGRVIVHASPVASPWPCSFDEKEISGDQVTIRNGAFRYHDVGVFHVADSTVTISGTAEAPTWVALQVNKQAGYAASIVALAAEPATNGSMWYFPLYTYYLNSAGVVVRGHSWREDVHAGSPIG